MLNTEVLLEDEALRNGLQIEPHIFSLEQKVALFHLLRLAGVMRIRVGSLVNQVSEQLSGVRVSLHLHDTRGPGLANMFAGYKAGVRIFDVCAGGLGGCPFIRAGFDDWW